MSTFEKVLSNVKSGKIARIDGSRKELRDAEKAIRELSTGEPVRVFRKSGSLYVATAEPLKISFVDRRLMA